MAKDDFQSAPMIFTRFKDNFAEVDYTLPIEGAFGVTAPLTAIELEARAKGCAVIIQVSLISLDDFYGTEPDTDEGDKEDDGSE